MNKYVREFIESRKHLLTGKLLEVGSYDVNGNIRDIVKVSVGVDMRSGPGVDLVCKVEDLPDHYQPGSFDSCVSVDTLEHVEDWKAFFRVTWDLVKPGGWLVMTAAHQHKGRHSYPDDYWRFDIGHMIRIYPRIHFCGPLGAPGKPISLGWVVQKTGELGSLDFAPYKV